MKICVTILFLCFLFLPEGIRLKYYLKKYHLNVLGDMYDCWPDWIIATFNNFFLALIAAGSNYVLLRWCADHDSNYNKL
jgi:hypothetical protein